MVFLCRIDVAIADVPDGGVEGEGPVTIADWISGGRSHDNIAAVGSAILLRGGIQ
jgi:hypothetical protein